MSKSILCILVINEHFTQETSPNYRDAILDVATEFLGSISIRYVTGHPELGQSPEGFDCSGFVRTVLTQAGLHVPDYIGMDDVRRPIRHASEFWDHYGVGVHNGLHTRGDLIFFSRNGYVPTHIGIVRDEESYIHAPGKDNTTVCVAGIKPKPIRPAHQDAKLLYAVDPIGFKAPTIRRAGHNPRYHQTLI